MAVTIRYIGGFGNTIFQYVRARLLAEQNNIPMLTGFPYKDVLPTTPEQYSSSVFRSVLPLLPRFRITDSNIHALSRLRKFYNYSLSGFFQDTHFINESYQQVQSFFKLPDIIPAPSDEVVIHIRLADFYHDDYLSPIHNGLSEIPHPEWYLEILKNISFNKLHIIIFDDPKFRNFTKKYLSYFKDYSPNIIMDTPMKEDFHFIRKFTTILSSNSTFSWWASFFSNATNIFIPAQTGYLGIGSTFKPHGKHIRDLWNIRNISTPVSCRFCDIRNL